MPPVLVASARRVLHLIAVRWPRVSHLIGTVLPEPIRVSQEPVHPSSSAKSARRDHLARLAGDPDYSERARAAKALAEVVDEETTAALVVALRDSSSEVAVSAIDALARHRGEVAISALSGVLRNDDRYFSPETRAAAVRWLGPLLSGNGGTVIASAVADADVKVSLAAIEALSERDDGASVEALLGVLENGTGYYLPMTRQKAARALQNLRSRGARQAEQRVRTLLETEPDAVVREALLSHERGHANPHRL